MLRTITLFALVAGCGGGAVSEPQRLPHPPHPATAHITPAEGVVVMEASCAEGAAERCDALDDDCDRQIDEGCEGAIIGSAVAVAWNAGADLDLVITWPSGRSELGASRGDCGDPAEPRIERASLGEARDVSYTIELVHAAPCGHEGPVTASVSVTATGQTGVYNRTIAPGERVPIATVLFQ